MNKEHKKVAIITGATSGIGAEATKVLAAEGMHLVLPVRSMQKGEQLRAEIMDKTPNAQIDLMLCNLSSLQSVKDFAKQFDASYSRLDVLINNAGVWETKRQESQDGIELTFAVNHLAPFLMTNLLLEKLKATGNSRIITVSSNAHKFARVNLDDLEGKKSWNSTKAYAQSKLANVLFTRSLVKLLDGTGVTAFSMHPGFVATNLFSKFPGFLMPLFSLVMVSPQKGAETLVYLATQPELENLNGGYFVNKKPASISKAGKDDLLATQLWEVSQSYVSKF